jgi:DNA-3-methyladenine glycosylase II
VNAPIATMAPTGQVTIRPRGAFSLQEAALFGFGQRLDSTWDGVMRLAFCLEPTYDTHVAVEVRQDDDGTVRGAVYGSDDLARVERQVARVLSLDFDGEVFAEVGRRDPVVGALQAVAPGLRPPLFYSPYEAAAWVVLSARRPRRQMAEVRRQLSLAYGTSFALAGEIAPALPTPEQLLAIEAFPGLPAEKVARLHGVARAALDGRLDVERFHRIGPEAAADEVQRLRGIGPFYASLIVVRASGFVDVLPLEETHLPGIIARLYDLDHTPSRAEVADLAERWRPMRTWVTVLIRAAGPRLLAGDGSLPPDPMLATRPGRAPRQAVLPRTASHR